MQEKITIIIADDHPIVRQGLMQAIEEDESLSVIGEAGDGDEALKAILSERPDIAILDIDMPGKNGFDVAKALKAADARSSIVFLTMHRDEDLFNEAIDIGARGFVLKDSALVDIIACIRTVAAGEYFTSHSVTTFLVNRMNRAGSVTTSRSKLDALTPAELKVLQLIADELTTKAIAELLFISPRTVEKHRENIAQKLDLQGSNALLRYAMLNRTKICGNT